MEKSLAGQLIDKAVGMLPEKVLTEQEKKELAEKQKLEEEEEKCPECGSTNCACEDGKCKCKDCGKEWNDEKEEEEEK